MHILTIIHENDSITRMVVGCDSAKEASLEVLQTLGYTVEVGFGDKPERDRDELNRLNVVLDDIHNHLIEKSGIPLPPPPRF